MNTVAHDSTHMLPKQSDSTRRNKFGRRYSMIVTYLLIPRRPRFQVVAVEQIYQKSVVDCRRGDTDLLDASVLVVLRDYCGRPALLHQARRPPRASSLPAELLADAAAPRPRGQTATQLSPVDPSLPAAKASPAPLLRPVCLSCGVNITRAGLGRRVLHPGSPLGH